MKSGAFYAVLGVGVLVVVGIMVLSPYLRKDTQDVTETTQPLAPIPVSEGTAIYASGTYDFYLVYPEQAVVEEDSETTSYHLPHAWRMHALPESIGAPVVSFITYRVQHEHAYPRYYYALVRIGVSTNLKEVSRCTEADTSSGEESVGETMFGDTPFSTFRFEDAAMMQYVKGTSYRAVHEGACYAIETIVTGSSYTEEGQVVAVSEEELITQKELLTPIATSFRFATPE